MKQRVITGLIFLIVMLAIIIPAYFVPLISVLLAIIVGSVSTHELIKALRHGGFNPSTPLIVIGEIITLGAVLAGYFLIKDLFLVTTLYLTVLLIYCLATAILPQTFEPERRLKDSLTTVLTILYICFPLYCLCATSLFFEKGWFYLIIGIAFSWVSDTCAYFSGVLLGKHKIVPHISPKKTWEGCIGGAFFCALTLMFYCGFVVYNIDQNIKLDRIPYMIVIFFFGILLSAMSQIGDWLASSVKRAVDIKDYGTFMPGHGGMLDRFDSVFFTLPVAFVIAILSLYI